MRIDSHIEDDPYERQYLAIERRYHFHVNVT